MRVTLEQWRMLKAVVEYGGFAQAAEVIHKSQSSINSSVRKLQKQLGIEVLTVIGRKAYLTEEGEFILKRAEHLLYEAGKLEDVVNSLNFGAEFNIKIAVSMALPDNVLKDALDSVSEAFPQTTFEVAEVVFGAGRELLDNNQVALAILDHTPSGFLGDLLMDVEFVCVVSPEHELAGLEREIFLNDLKMQRQLVLEGASNKISRDVGSLDNEQEWMFDHIRTLAEFASRGLGFAWLPKLHIQNYLKEGTLIALPLAENAVREMRLHVIIADRDKAGPVTDALKKALVEASRYRGEAQVR